MKVKILVTGGSGMVGQAIKNLITDTRVDEEEWLFISSKDVDLVDYNTTWSFFKNWNPTYVIHLAANVGGLYKNLYSNVDMFYDNMMINMNVLKVCNEIGVEKMICCLSTCIFPNEVDKYPITEKMLHLGEPHPSNKGYAYSKRMLQVLCSMYNENYNRKYICVIPCNIYGPYDNFNINDAHVIPALIHKAYIAHRDNDAFIINGSGKALRQFIHSEDVGKLCIWLLFNYQETESIILAPKQSYSIKDVVDMIRKYTQLNYKQIVYDETFTDGQYLKPVSNYKLLELYQNIEKQEYKFISFENGLKATIEWFKTNYDECRK